MDEQGAEGVIILCKFLFYIKYTSNLAQVL